MNKKWGLPLAVVAALAIGQKASRGSHETESDVSVSDDVSARSNDSHGAALAVVGDVVEPMRLEADLWSKVLETRPEAAAMDRAEELWTNPSPEFLEYLNLWQQQDLGLEPLFQRNLLPRAIYQRYMDVNRDYAEFREYIERMITYIQSPNSGFSAEQRARYTASRQDQLAMLDALTEHMATHNNGEDNSREYISTIFNGPSGGVDPALIFAILINETMPGIPGDVSAELRLNHALAMLQAGFEANGKLSNSDLPVFNDRLDCLLSQTAACVTEHGDDLHTTKHITTGYPHLTFSTAGNIFRMIHNNPSNPMFEGIVLEGAPSDPDFVSRNFTRVVTDLGFAMQIGGVMDTDNSTRFSAFFRNNAEVQQFINNSNNGLAINAINFYFNHVGGNEAQFNFVANALEKSGYNQNIFITEMTDPNNYEDQKVSSAEYIESGLEMYTEITRVLPELLARFSN